MTNIIINSNGVKLELDRMSQDEYNHNSIPRCMARSKERLSVGWGISFISNPNNGTYCREYLQTSQNVARGFYE